MTESRNISISVPSTGEEEWQALREPLLSGWLTQGPKVEAFEQAFAKRHQVKQAIATTSGTTALHLILAALEIGPGDEVILPAFTWIATANVVLYCGATPVFVDVDPVTYNLAIDRVLDKVTARTKAIIPVHLFGLCVDMDALVQAVPHIPLIEDAACAAGATYKGRSAGSLGIAGAFSFHPRKTLTTGEGGMVTVNDEALADKMRSLRSHGTSMGQEQRHLGPKPYLLPEFNLLGFNYRMSDLQAAVGLVQLNKLDRLVAERRQWAIYYHQALSSLKWLQTPTVSAECDHSWQAYVCYVHEDQAPMPRNALMEALQAQGVGTRPGTHAIHQLGYYKNRFGFQVADFIGAWNCDRYSLALPLHNRMTAEDYQYVVDVLKSLS
jgi:perosamine synthetase